MGDSADGLEGTELVRKARRRTHVEGHPSTCQHDVEWKVGAAVEVLWHGKPYDGTVCALDDKTEKALVAYDPPFDRYPPEWR